MLRRTSRFSPSGVGRMSKASLPTKERIDWTQRALCSCGHLVVEHVPAAGHRSLKPCAWCSCRDYTFWQIVPAPRLADTSTQSEGSTGGNDVDMGAG